MIWSRIQRYGRTATLALAVFVFAGCAGEAATPAATPSHGPSALVSPTTDPSTAATDQVLAAYRSYQKAYQAAAAVPNPDDTALLKYVGDPLLSQVRHDLSLLKANGLARQGTPNISATVTELRLDATPPVATIRDCYDVSHIHVINKTTGKSADAPNQPTRYLVTSQAKFYGTSTGWLIVVSNADRNSRC